MFRNSISIAPRKGKITTVILAPSVVCLLLGCTGDKAATLTSESERPSSPEPGTSGGSNATPAAERPEESAPSAPDVPASTEPGVESPGTGAGTGVGGANASTGGANASTGGAAEPVAGEACWQLPRVNRARLFAAPGAVAALVGGKIVGSNTSPMNDFVDLALVVQPPAKGQWLALTFDNTTPYRYIKYYGRAGSRSVLAELELYQGEQRLTGAAFGSLGSGDGVKNGFERALDGDTSTWYEGALPNDNYVGLDVAAGHVASAPTFTPAAGAASAGDSVVLAAEAGASVSFTTDGTDPRSAGTPYTAPVALPPGTTLLRAVATRPCALESEVVQAVYEVPGSAGATARPAPSAQRSVQSSMHIGNSLTDTIVGYLEPVALSGGISLAFHRYTIPGAGTWLYDQNPTGGFGEPNVQQSLRTQPFDHVTMQPFPNLPCQPLPSSDGPDSDSGYVNQAWADARTQNPNVQLWIYQQWPSPTDFVNCITGGSWTRADWQPPAPRSWEDAVATELSYDEVVRSEVARLNPGAPEPYIIPAGLALSRLKRAVEAGQVPGVNDFFATLFKAGGADIHMTGAGAYFVSLVFYACMFQASPEGLVNESDGELTEAQAAVFQRLAWETVTGYALSGVNR